MSELPKAYKPSDHEAEIYERWETSGYFHPEKMVEAGLTDSDAEPYTIMLPPPNATGVLHMGHALMISWQDLLIRWARMHGKRVLWLPGTDHAAIATQARVEKDISKAEGKSRYDLGRDLLLARIDAYVDASRSTIQRQLRVMGATCDWQREAFTLDDRRSLAVRTVFAAMYEDGLIYRGYRIVNWDPKGQTTISDDEIVYEERQATLYTFRYSRDFPIPIASTRPETKVGDVAVAVHPDDSRYKEFIGRKYDLEFCGVPLSIRIVGDRVVDPKFGTGAVGVTPAHSSIDWEIAERHDLPRPQVINERGRMMVDGDLKDLKVTEGRERIVDWLRDQGLLEKEEQIQHNIATAERTGAVVEPLPKTQWFVDVNKEFALRHSRIPNLPVGTIVTLKELMRTVVENGQITILPDHIRKVYFHWIDNLRDWCISRQIWYGHRIPVYYRNSAKSNIQNPNDKQGEEMYVGVEAPEGEGWEQDPDTLDTWFSSGLWTFSTLGWPLDDASGRPTLLPDGQINPDSDLSAYHPTTLIQPGTEILFFWVARMILMTTYTLGDIPFRTVLLNGIVRDEQGRKISKSLRNGKDPIDLATQYGADAIRLYFATTATPGADSRLLEDKIKGYQHFLNKVWNIARFIVMNREVDQKSKIKNWSSDDAKILTELAELSDRIDKHIENYRFHLAAEELYHYVWHELADKILEEKKDALRDPARGAEACALLDRILRTVLRLLHPFTPFLTEYIWMDILGEKQMLLVSRWPTADEITAEPLTK